LPAAVLPSSGQIEETRVIPIGIDPHKASYTAVALDPEGRVLGELPATATRTTTERLLHWAERYASADCFASYSGTAPIEVSSGEVTRHRLSRNGNRSLNNASHLGARVQTMHPGLGRDHYERKLAEHKSSREALRSLKRQLAKVVYRRLVVDQVHRLALGS
jgi:hypothetical protein